jgi:hypothetical protein
MSALPSVRRRIIGEPLLLHLNLKRPPCGGRISLVGAQSHKTIDAAAVTVLAIGSGVECQHDRGGTFVDFRVSIFEIR